MRYSEVAILRLIIPIFALLVSGSVAAVANETSEKPPTVEEIVASLKATEYAIETLHATYICLEKVNFVAPEPGVGSTVHKTRRTDVSWEVTRAGCARMEAVTQLTTKAQANGREVVVVQKFVSAFDGSRGCVETTTVAADGSEKTGTRYTDDFSICNETTPFELTMLHHGTPGSTLLSRGQAKLVGTDRWEDRPVAVVALPPVAERKNYNTQERFWIDVEHGTLVRRLGFFQRGKDKPWELHTQVDAKGYSEASPGVWLPKAVNVRKYSLDREGQGFLASRKHFGIADWQVNAKIDPPRLPTTFRLR